MRNALLVGTSVLSVAFAASAAQAANPNAPPSSPYAMIETPSAATSDAPLVEGRAANIAPARPICVNPRYEWSQAPLSDGNTGDYSNDI